MLVPVEVPLPGKRIKAEVKPERCTISKAARASRAANTAARSMDGSMTMSVPVLVLLGFAAWTLLTLFGTIGVYRWSRILTGRASIAEWRADLPPGSGWYQRAPRAPMKFGEKPPIYTALGLGLLAPGLHSPPIDPLSPPRLS